MAIAPPHRAEKHLASYRQLAADLRFIAGHCFKGEFSQQLLDQRQIRYGIHNPQDCQNLRESITRLCKQHDTDPLSWCCLAWMEVAIRPYPHVDFMKALDLIEQGMSLERGNWMSTHIWMMISMLLKQHQLKAHFLESLQTHKRTLATG